MIKTIFFDIDNTLLDHKGAEKKALFQIKNKYFPKINNDDFEKIWVLETKKNWKLYEEKKLTFEKQRNNRIIDIWFYYNIKIDSLTAKKILDEYLEFYESNWKTFKGIDKLFNFLKNKNIRLGIISNGDKNQQINKLKKINLYKYIDSKLIITSGDLKYSKPDEKIFNYAINKTKNSNNEILMIGDSLEQDIITPKKLGLNTFLIDNSTEKGIQNLRKYLNKELSQEV